MKLSAGAFKYLSFLLPNDHLLDTLEFVTSFGKEVNADRLAIYSTD